MAQAGRTDNMAERCSAKGSCEVFLEFSCKLNIWTHERFYTEPYFEVPQ